MAITGLSKKEYLKGMKEGTLTEAQIADYQVPGPFSFIGYLKVYFRRQHLGRSRTVDLNQHDVAGDHYYSEC